MPLQGQAAVEFLAFLAIGIAMLAFSLVSYSIYSSAASQTQRTLEAEGICIQVSSFFGSFASLGDGATASLSLSRPYAGSNYTVWMLGDRSLVRVDYEISGEKRGAGCHFPAANVTNATGGQVFALARHFTLKNNRGVIVVAQ